MPQLPKMTSFEEAELRALYKACGISSDVTELAIKMRRQQAAAKVQKKLPSSHPKRKSGPQQRSNFS
jgi:hypothetical protein